MTGRALTALFAMGLAGVAPACRRAPEDPPVPAGHAPDGKDLVLGAVVAAEEKSGGVRIYLIKEVKFLPPPSTDALLMVAFKEKGDDFLHAAKLYRQRKLTVALNLVDVERHRFIARDYRVLAVEELGDEVPKLQRDDALGPVKAIVKTPAEVAAEYAAP